MKRVVSEKRRLRLAIAGVLSLLLGVASAACIYETCSEAETSSVELKEELVLTQHRETEAQRKRIGFRYGEIPISCVRDNRSASNPRRASSSEHAARNGLGRPLTT